MWAHKRISKLLYPYKPTSNSSRFLCCSHPTSSKTAGVRPTPCSQLSSLSSHHPLSCGSGTSWEYNRVYFHLLSVLGVIPLFPSFKFMLWILYYINKFLKVKTILRQTQRNVTPSWTPSTHRPTHLRGPPTSLLSGLSFQCPFYTDMCFVRFPCFSHKRWHIITALLLFPFPLINISWKNTSFRVIQSFRIISSSCIGLHGEHIRGLFNHFLRVAELASCRYFAVISSAAESYFAHMPFLTFGNVCSE